MDLKCIKSDTSAASEVIQWKLNRVLQMAEKVDVVLRDIGVLCDGSADGSNSGVVLDLNSSVEEGAGEAKVGESPSTRCSSDQESAVTAPLWNPTSRSSSYHTASECRSSPWWDSEKNSDPEVDVDVEHFTIQPGSASTSFDGSDNSLLSSSLCSYDIDKKLQTPGSSDGEGDEEDADTTSSTISQISSKNVAVRHQKELEIMSMGEVVTTEGGEVVDEKKKVSGANNAREPDFMAWNRYYRSIINKQTLRSCL